MGDPELLRGRTAAQDIVLLALSNCCGKECHCKECRYSDASLEKEFETASISSIIRKEFNKAVDVGKKTFNMHKEGELEVGQVLHRANRHVLAACTPAGTAVSPVKITSSTVTSPIFSHLFDCQ